MIYQGLINGEEKLAVVGLGYVGMPIAVEFAKHIPVIGFDINEKRVNEYANGIDATNEVGEAIKNTTVDFTSDPARLREAKFLIVAVPTPVNPDTTPNLRPIEGASRTVGQNLIPGSIVVFESTVYPGVTEDVCIPIIERESGLKCGEDWKVGYSPERINPRRPGSYPDEYPQDLLRHGRGVRARDPAGLRHRHQGGDIPRLQHQDRRGGEGDREQPAGHQHCRGA